MPQVQHCFHSELHGETLFQITKLKQKNFFHSYKPLNFYENKLQSTNSMSAEFVVRVVKTLPVVAYNCVSKDDLLAVYGLMVCTVKILKFYVQNRGCNKSCNVTHVSVARNT